MSFNFTNHGHFKNFEYYIENEIDVLADSIADSVGKNATTPGESSTLIIHFYQTMIRVEIEPIQYELKNLGLEIPVFIITINQNESRDILAFDKNVMVECLRVARLSIWKESSICCSTVPDMPYIT